MSPWTVAALVAAAAAITALLTPAAARLAVRWGFIDRPAGHKFHAEATPLLGGLALAVGALLPLAVLRPDPRFGSFAAAAVLLVAVGLWDDRRRVSVAGKLAAQSAAALVLVGGGFRAEAPLPGWAAAVLAFLWIVGLTNACNLLDSIDGAAAGVAAVAAAGGRAPRPGRQGGGDGALPARRPGRRPGLGGRPRRRRRRLGRRRGRGGPGAGGAGVARASGAGGRKGMTLHAMGEAVEALENTIRSIALNPKMEHAYVMKGSLEDDLGFPTRALRTYDRLLEINPDSYMAWLNKGITLIKQRRHAEAEAAFHRARAASSPPLSTAWPQTATMRRNGTRRSHAAKRRAERQRSPASAARRRRTSTTASRPARQR